MNHQIRFSHAALGSALALVLAMVATLPVDAATLPPAVEAVRAALQHPKAAVAVAAAERAIAAHPGSAEAWYYAGQAFGKMAMEVSMIGKPKWAGRTRDAFQKAAQLDPDHLGAREGLVQFYSMAPSVMGGGKDKAEAEIASLTKRDPAAGHYLRGATTKGSAAERDLRAAVKLQPDETRYRRALIAWLDGQKRVPEALAVLDAGLARHPRPTALPDDVPLAGAHWRRGQLHEKKGRKAEALADYRRAVVLLPGLDSAKKDAERLAATGG